MCQCIGDAMLHLRFQRAHLSFDLAQYVKHAQHLGIDRVIAEGKSVHRLLR